MNKFTTSNLLIDKAFNETDLESNVLTKQVRKNTFIPVISRPGCVCVCVWGGTPYILYGTDVPLE